MLWVLDKFLARDRLGGRIEQTTFTGPCNRLVGRLLAPTEGHQASMDKHQGPSIKHQVESSIKHRARSSRVSRLEGMKVNIYMATLGGPQISGNTCPDPNNKNWCLGNCASVSLTRIVVIPLAGNFRLGSFAWRFGLGTFVWETARRYVRRDSVA